MSVFASRWLRGAGVLIVLLAAGLVAWLSLPSASAQRLTTARPGLTAFRSDEELREFFRKLQRQRQQRERGEAQEESGGVPPPPPAPPPPPPPPAMAQSADSIVVTGARVGAPSLQGASPASITNNQEVGVDEGGIVKVRGDTLVILRRGRLFTVSTAGGGLRPIDSIQAFPPGVSGQGDWYDEMLVSGDRVIVVGYSYARGGTEINRFRLEPSGRLRFEDAYHLRSNDYYSSRNYASRLIGNRLIYYTPLYLDPYRDPIDQLPGIRRWRGEREDRSFTRITRPQQVFIPPVLRDRPDVEINTLHSVITCDLTAPQLDCEATSVLGPSSRTFYVSANAVYLWISDFWTGNPRRGRPQSAFVYRLPFDQERPSAVAARGSPIDQFSFQADPEDGMLNVLLRMDGGGDAMFSPEVSQGGVALLRIPMEAFGTGSRELPRRHYRPLPSPRGENWNFHNRFVGGHILYGAGGFARGQDDRGASLIVARVRGGEPTELDLPHSIDRIEVLGRDGLVVGGDPRGDLNFSAIDLSGSPRVGNRYVHPAASEGETRSHAYFYNPSTADGRSGVLGLPIQRRVGPAFERFFGSAASILFLRRDERRFSPAGELEANVRGVIDDACVASCVDWYGNARPIFLGPRTFALLGYELVEGAMQGPRIREVRRVNFAPQVARMPRRQP